VVSVERVEQFTSEGEVLQLFGRSLVVAAHPDDIAFGFGGTAYTLARGGQPPVCAVATRGEQGTQDPDLLPPEQLAEIRASEQAEESRILGVTDYYLHDFPDDGCERVPLSQALKWLISIISKHQPDTVVTFESPKSRGITGNPDHEAVAGWVLAAVGRLAVLKPGLKLPEIYGMVKTAEVQARLKQNEEFYKKVFYALKRSSLISAKDCAVRYKLPEDVARIQRKAYQASASQTAELCRDFPEELDILFETETFVRILAA